MICEKCEALNALIDGYRRERDEARASVAAAYRRGAEAMRDAAANALDMAGHGTLCDTSACEHCGRYVRALPIPEEP